jgi:deoxyribodipyrimidine photo-lyase
MEMLPLPFVPTRAAGLQRLQEFLPRAGLAYACNRNLDLPGQPHVSALSPWLRHRLVTEEEVIKAAVDWHGASAAEKFVSEVLWRSYWKGFLEMRPGLWSGYRQGLNRALDRVATEAGLRRQWEDACAGRTGIEGFDDWARALVATGWLHNHARMWFASIWIFTLRLPWELGADFFMNHLLDGDPASNTLSWRWVAGLHTPGKTYLATADNIERNTGGRFRPNGLATQAAPVTGIANPAPAPIIPRKGPDPSLRTALLLHEDDLSPDPSLVGGTVAAAILTATAGRSPLAVAQGVQDFALGAARDAASALSGRGLATGLCDGVAAALDWARASGAAQIVTPHAPVGPMAVALRQVEAGLAADGIRLVRVMRPWDARLWPLATHGFFRFREAVGPV